MKSKILLFVIFFLLNIGCEKGEMEDIFDLQGNRISEFEFKLRGETGTLVVYYKNGNKKASTTLINGDPIRQIEWYRNGNKKKEYEYTKSFSDWKETTWYENGQKEREKEIKDRTDHGKEIWWYKNGQKESECDYFEGQLHGKWIFWDENGQLKSIMEFKNGNITRHSIFKDGKMIRDNYPQKKKKK